MSRPTIGCVIATPGRRSLLRTLYSIAHQGLIEGDDVLVVGDGHHQPTAEIVELMGPPFRYQATTKTRDWGHSQQNYGLKHVRGDWLVLQDDDDIFLPRAFDEIRTIAAKLESPRPIIGRVMTPYLGILWTEPGKEPLDGHCLVVPNDKSKLGYLGLEYAGDQTWLASNLEKYDTYSWADRIWSLTRPTAKLWPVLFEHSPGECFTWVFSRDDGGVAGEQVLSLTMQRDGDRWRSGTIALGDATEDEYREVVQFAAWAGQGCDVYVRTGDKNVRAIKALVSSGYKLYCVDPTSLEYVFDWPPHKFEPPKQEVV